MCSRLSGSPRLSPSRPARPSTEAIRRRLDRCYLVVHPPAGLDHLTAPPTFDRLLTACGLTDHFTVRRPTPRRKRQLGGADPSRR